MMKSVIHSVWQLHRYWPLSFSAFQTFLRPFGLLLAWFVDVAIQFVMLSQYGRGWSVIMHMYYSSNSPLRYLHLGNLFTVFQWVSVCVQCFQPLPRIEWLRDYRTGLELARVPRVPGTTEFLDTLGFWQFYYITSCITLQFEDLLVIGTRCFKSI